VRLGARCHAILGLSCTPPWTVNAGVVAGDARTLLVDTGANAASAETILGYAEAVRPGNPLVAIVTEPHLDHLLGSATLRARGVPVHGHHRVARRPADAEIADLAAAVTDPARKREAAVFFAGTRVENPDRPLAAETALDLGGVAAEVLFTPGHTPANLVVWIASEGVLFSGDTVVDGYLPNLEAGGPPDWAEWLRSLARIEALGAATLVPGHGAVLRGAEVPAGIARVRAVLERALETGRPPTGPGAAP
jgi:cyclase